MACSSRLLGGDDGLRRLRFELVALLLAVVMASHGADAGALQVRGGRAAASVAAGLNATHAAGSLSQVSGSASMYTTDVVCIKQFCLNPIFPGISYFGENVLSIFGTKTWTCVDNPHEMWKHAGFCSRVVSAYPFSVASPQNGKAAYPVNLIATQEANAIRMYFAHVAAMGIEPWSVTEPWNRDDCVQEVWKMACYTNFPRCNEIEPTKYLPPCKSSCQNYLNQCKVRCCDEGVQCVFTHKKKDENGAEITEEGYIDHNGPSPLCTGDTARMLGLVPSALGFMSVAVTIAMGVPTRWG